jgi:hypothetical protein
MMSFGVFFFFFFLVCFQVDYKVQIFLLYLVFIMWGKMSIYSCYKVLATLQWFVFNEMILTMLIVYVDEFVMHNVDG